MDGAADGDEEILCAVEGGKGTRDLGVDLRWCPDSHSADPGGEVVIVSKVHEGGGCESAGLVAGDVLLRLNDKPLQVRRRAASARGARREARSRSFTFTYHVSRAPSGGRLTNG